MNARRSRKKVQADKPEVSASGLSNVPAMTVSQYISKFKVPFSNRFFCEARQMGHSLETFQTLFGQIVSFSLLCSVACV